MRTAVIVMCFVALGFGVYMAVTQVDPDSVALNEEEKSGGVRFPNVVELKDLPPAFEQRLSREERPVLQRGFSALNNTFNQLEEQVAPFRLEGGLDLLRKGVKVNSLGEGGSAKEYRMRRRIAKIEMAETRLDLVTGIMDMASGPVAASALLVSGSLSSVFMLISPQIESSRWSVSAGGCASACTAVNARRGLDSAFGECVAGQAKHCLDVPAAGSFETCSQGLLVCLSNYWLELDKHRSTACSCARKQCAADPTQWSLFCAR